MEQENRGMRIATMLEDKDFTNVGYTIFGDNIAFVAVKPENSPSIQVTRPDGVNGQEAASILGLDYLSSESDELHGLSLDVFDEGEVISEDFHTRGGRKISGGGSQCTTGFSVVNLSNGVQGVSTAGHCTGMNLFDATPPEADYPTFFQRQHIGSWGDMEWHTTRHWELPEFQVDSSGTHWNIHSVATGVSVGDVVCGSSRMQNYRRRCDRVKSTSYSAGGTGNLVLMESGSGLTMTGGDSGGPWTYGSTAYGTVVGAVKLCRGWWIFKTCKWHDLW